MSKVLGKDINEFYNHHLPECYFIEGQFTDYWNVHDENGNLALIPNNEYELKHFGDLIPYDGDRSKAISFKSAFKKWQEHQRWLKLARYRDKVYGKDVNESYNNQTYVSVVLEIPTDKVDEVVTTLNQFFPSVKVVK